MPDPDEKSLYEIAHQALENPFYTPEYVAARIIGNTQPWILGVRDGDRWVSACTAFMSHGRLTRQIEITSLPAPLDGDFFWPELLKFCKEQRIDSLEINSFGSTDAVVPALAWEVWRKRRTEYVLSLDKPNLISSFSTNHRRNIKRAEKAGLKVRVATGPEVCMQHGRLISASMDRRVARGEDVDSNADGERYRCFIDSGAATFYQAYKDGELYSSILILNAERGAYYHSAGTSPEGMAMGASQFLICRVAEILQKEGKNKFNLGGADLDQIGLTRFKLGFRPKRFEIEAAQFFLSSTFKRKCLNALREFRSDPLTFINSLFGTIDRYVVYTRMPETLRACDELSDARANKLGDDELREAIQEHSEFSYLYNVWNKLGHNDAYGVYIGDDLAHIAWLIPSKHDHDYPERNVKLREGEAEITHCSTRKKYRGRGLYQFAIRHLVDRASADGMKRIFMITASDNTASKRGIEKAGLTYVGKLFRIRPRIGLGYSFALRGHRMKGLSYF